MLKLETLTGENVAVKYMRREKSISKVFCGFIVFYEMFGTVCNSDAT